MKLVTTKQRIGLACLCLILTLTGKASAADIDCLPESVWIEKSTFLRNHILGNCSNTNSETGSLRNITIYYRSDANILRTGSALAVSSQINVTHLGVHDSKYIFDVGTEKPTLASCSTKTYSLTQAPAIEGHWYCTKYLGTENTGYMYGKFINSTIGLKPPIMLDIDSNNNVDALTDGLLILRYLFGFQGNNLIDDVVGDGAARNNATEIEAYLAAITSLTNTDSLNIDDNVNVDALTDGLLILRYLFGFRDTSLTDGVVADNANRTLASDIEVYLEALITP